MPRPPIDVEDDAPEDVASFEQRLRRAADEQLGEATDDGLRSILTHVRDRRTRRTGGTVLIDPPIIVDEPVAADELEPVDEPVLEGSPGRILSVEDVGPTVRLLRIGRPPGFTFRAGQYLKAGMPGTGRSSFSIASAPHESHLELCVQLRPGGRITPAMFAARPGDEVDLGDAPKGRFLRDESATTHLMIATTTGLAPLRSMIRDARHRSTAGVFVVLHGASHADELPYHDELAADPSVSYLPTVSRPAEARNQAWTGTTGRVDALARRLAESFDPATTRVYACGNPGMIDQVEHDLGAAGFAVSSEAYD